MLAVSLVRNAGFEPLFKAGLLPCSDWVCVRPPLLANELSKGFNGLTLVPVLLFAPEMVSLILIAGEAGVERRAGGGER